MSARLHLLVPAVLALTLLPSRSAPGNSPLAPPFETTTLQGERISSKALLGKVVLLDFWGTWCPPCIGAVPGLRSLTKDLEGQPFVLVSIAVEQDDEELRSFVSKNRMSWPQVWDRNASLSHRFGVGRFPTYILVGPQGDVLYSVIGSSQRVERDLRQRILAALATTNSSGPAGDVTR